jgi:hypothetical protein
MELAFATQRLRSVCEDDTVAAAAFDAPVVEQLKARLADLRAAESIYDLLIGDPLILPGGNPRVAVGLADGYALIATPNHRATPLAPDGAVDWRRVRRLQLLEIMR